MKLIPVVTKQDGDSAFHAIFGKPNRDKEYVCDNVKACREKVAQVIRISTPKSDIFPSIVFAIEELIRAKNRPIQLDIANFPSIGTLQRKYDKNNENFGNLTSKVINEYAQFIEASGMSLLPCELGLVAYAHKITVNLKNNQTDELFKHSPEGQGIANIYFDGINYYQAMEEKATVENAFLLKGEGGYSASGLKGALPGDIYQLKLLMLFLHRGCEKEYEFRLATEMDAAEKFDDLVFQYKKLNDPTYTYRYIQAKHKLGKNALITATDLFNETEGDFSLQKYFISYQKIKQRIKDQSDFTDGELGEFCICTNIGFDFDEIKPVKKKANKCFKLKEALELEVSDEILQTIPSAVKYKFKQDEYGNFSFPGSEEIFNILRRSSGKVKLAQALIKCMKSNKQIDKRTPIFKEHYSFLIDNKIIDNKTNKFAADFFTSTTLSPEAQQFRVFCTQGENAIDESVTNDEIKDFLQHLVFAVNQPNEMTLGKIITKELGTTFNLIDSEPIYNNFQRATLDWMKKKKGTFLTQEDIKEFFTKNKRNIAQLMLISQTKVYKEELKQYTINSNIEFKFSEIISQFLKEEGNPAIIYQAPGSVLVGSIEVQQTLQKICKEHDGYIFMPLKTALLLENELESTFARSESQLLVLTCDNKIKKSEVKFIQGLFANLPPDKKIIFITADGQNLSDIINNPTIELIPAKIGFESLTEASQKKLQAYTVVFQESRLQLNTLVENLENIIDEEVLAELITDKEISISKSFNTELSYYINREFNHNIQIQKEGLQGNVGDIFAIIGEIDQNKLSNILGRKHTVRYFLKKDAVGAQPSRYIILNNEAQFNQICTENPTHSVHLLKWEADKFIWQRSQGNFIALRQYTQPEDAKAPEQGYTIISAAPGMGKSTVLSHLAQNIKKDHSKRWIIQANLLELEKGLKGTNFIEVKSIIDFFMKDASNLARKIFTDRLSHSGELTIFLDGFDEIQAAQQDKVIQLLQILKTTKTKQVIITTRPHMRERLEDALGVFAHDLKPFDKVARRDFFEKYWKKKLKLSEIDRKKVEAYSDKLTKVFEESTNDKQNEFIGVPLQAKLLALAFLREFEEFHADPSSTEPKISKRISLHTLYQRFIKIKYDILLEKKLGLSEHSQIADLKYSVIKSLTKGHQLVAWTTLFPKFAIKAPSPDVNELLRKAGIVQFINNKPHFIHRTFAEYFTAELLVKGLKSHEGPIYQRHKDILIRQIFKDRNYIICTFVDELVNSSKNLLLKQEWEVICRANLLPNNKHKFIIDDDLEQVTWKDEQINWEEAKRNLEQCYLSGYRIGYAYRAGDKDEVRYGEVFCKSALNIADVEKLTESLTFLHKVITNTPSDNLRQRTAAGLSDIFMHYIKVCKDEGKIFNNDLIQVFKETKYPDGNNCFSVELFEAIDKLHDRMVQKQEITLDFIEELIRPSNEKGLYCLVTSLYTKFLHCKLDDKKIEGIFLENDAPGVLVGEDQLWLSSFGIVIVKAFKVLTPIMSAMFIKAIIHRKAYYFGHSTINYISDIWHKLLLPLLDCLDAEMVKQGINKIALINMCVYFMQFLQQHDNNFLFKITSSGIQNLLSLIKSTLNGQLNEEILSICIKQLYLLNQMGLQIIDTNTSLLLLDPTEKFEYDLQLKHKDAIQKLLVFKAKNVKNKDEFKRRCARAIQTLRKNNDSARFMSKLERITKYSNSTRLSHKLKRPLFDSSIKEISFFPAKKAKKNPDDKSRIKRGPIIAEIIENNADLVRNLKRAIFDSNSKKTGPQLKKLKTEKDDFSSFRKDG
jgi:hypothetical protein